jgi:diguanylate cyclase (GGDEF)-like protein
MMRVRGVLAIAVAVFAASLPGIGSRLPGSLAVLWLANALLLGLLIRYPGLRRRPAIWCAAAVGYASADIAFGTPLEPALIMAAANLTGVVVGLLGFMALDDPDDRRLATIAGVIRVFAVCGAASSMSAVVGAVATVNYFGGTWRDGWLSWFAADLVNYTSLLPLVLLWPVARQWSVDSRRIRTVALSALALVAMLTLAYVLRASGSAIAFAVPALLTAALTCGVFTTSVLVAVSNYAMLGLSVGVGAAVHPAPISVITEIALSLLAVGPLAVSAAMQERRRLLAELRRATTRDDLTGVLRRGEFHTQAEASLCGGARARAPHSSAAVLMMDLDHFKRLNDTFGHQAGDRALAAFADILRDELGHTSPHDGEPTIVGRLGGEEFAAMVPNVTPVRARELAEKVRMRQSRRASSDFGSDGSTVSIGLAWGGSGSTLSDLLNRADAAVYEAKSTRNCVVESLAWDGRQGWPVSDAAVPGRPTAGG